MVVRDLAVEDSQSGGIVDQPAAERSCKLQSLGARERFRTANAGVLQQQRSDMVFAVLSREQSDGHWQCGGNGAGAELAHQAAEQRQAWIGGEFVA